jgi:hypothetical protein
MIWLTRHPTVSPFIMQTHTKARGFSGRSFVGILNQSKLDLWNAAVVVVCTNLKKKTHNF